MPTKHRDAAARARSGQVSASTVTIDRPDTQIKAPNGDVFTLPRRRGEGADVVVYGKANASTQQHAGGRRSRQKQALGGSSRPKTLGFSAVAITAFVGFRAAQLLVRCLRRKRAPSEEELLQAALEQQAAAQAQQQLPPVRVMPGMLRRALPTLGPPSRVKRLAAAHRGKQRRVPHARAANAPPTGAAQRRVTTLEKWEAAVRRQAHALMVQQQQLGGLPGTTAGQQACRASVLPLPGGAVAATSGLLLPPQPLLEVAAAATEDEDEQC